LPDVPRQADDTCMHGSAWRGNGEMLIGNLADALAPIA
jgi:hypothetical protein